MVEPSNMTHWSALLDSVIGTKWRTVGLRLSRLLQAEKTPGDPNESAMGKDRFDVAWALAEALEALPNKRTGRFCTPRSLALELVSQVGTEPVDLWIDPACGAGALLLAAAELETRRTGAFDFNRLWGFDIDRFSLAMAETVVWVAAGQPPAPVGRFQMRDFLRCGAPRINSKAAAFVVNPPWGIKPSKTAFHAWQKRVGAKIDGVLSGELNIYTTFLLEIVLRIGARSGFITPIHWLHRRSLAQMRNALASAGRLERVIVVRKRVFKDAPDMIPVLTIWSHRPTSQAIKLSQTGFRTPLPLEQPLSFVSSTDLTHPQWQSLPYCVFPLLRSNQLGALGQKLLDEGSPIPRLADPRVLQKQRLFHLGDGAYKSKVRPHVVEEGSGMPIFTRASQVGRYRHDSPCQLLNATGQATLTAGERHRFGQPKLVLHALKKAAALWRIATAIGHVTSGPIAYTNNFLIGLAERYDGHLAYPLTLMNSRLFNRIYTEQFPGVNIEAYTVGLMPCPWPPKKGGFPAPEEAASDQEWHRWSSKNSAGKGCLRQVVYSWLVEAGRTLLNDLEGHPDLERRVEAVVGGLLLAPWEVVHELERVAPA